MSMQTSVPPQIPKQSLAPVFLGLGAALVVAVVAWKLAGSEPSKAERTATVAGAPVAAPAPAVVSAAEPPPPPPEQEAAPVRSLGAAPARPATAQPELSPPPAPVKRDPNCDDPCRGKETPELLGALGAKAGQARSCYERALSNNAALAGKLEVGVRVSPTGEACSAQVGKDSLGDAAVTSCVLQRFRGGKYPKPTGGCVTVSVPMNFMPAGSR